MKKIIAFFALLAMIFSLTACGEDKQNDLNTGDTNDTVSGNDGKGEQIDFNIAETKDIVLGNEVNSVTIKTVGGGQLTFDSSADFYEIFDNISFELEDGKKCSVIAEIKLADKSRSYINMNSYHYGDADLYDLRVKKEGDDAIAVCEDYMNQSANGETPMTAYSSCCYKEEKAFVGSENGVRYSSSKYPWPPNTETELSDMQNRGWNLLNLINSTELFARYETFEIGGETYNLDDFVKREYKLYENYIVFKQTAPFLNVIDTGAHLQIMYAQILASDFSVTQEAYYNVETGKIEFIRVYGETIWHTAEYAARKMEIDIQMYLSELDHSEKEQKLQSLINRVKSNAE